MGGWGVGAGKKNEKSWVCFFGLSRKKARTIFGEMFLFDDGQLKDEDV